MTELGASAGGLAEWREGGGGCAGWTVAGSALDLDMDMDTGAPLERTGSHQGRRWLLGGGLCIDLLVWVLQGASSHRAVLQYLHQ
jgi:hypothetical protein